MNLEEKLALLKACDFSEWRGSERASAQGLTANSDHGFGNCLTSLNNDLYNLGRNFRAEESITGAVLKYEILSNRYATIPFEKMEPNDEDFKFLFSFKEKLEKFGSIFKIFVANYQQPGFSFEGNPEYSELKAILRDLLRMNYREQILAKYDIRFK
jgi:hypothetical protein